MSRGSVLISTWLFVAGYYCPSGSSVETEIICPAAKHCPTGSDQPQDCLAGTHADHTGAASCTECPEGQFTVYILYLWFRGSVYSLHAVFVVQRTGLTRNKTLFSVSLHVMFALIAPKSE